MRIIKFRGKDIETCEWVYGNLIQRIGYMPGIMFSYESNGKVRYAESAVKRETIGQFTGLYDYNENEIYEGDILRHIQWENNEEVLYYITFEEEMGSFVLQKPTLKHKDNISQLAIYGLKLEVIGNVHDNPELLKGE